ncbi:MAG: PfkB family carbohydrate kinase [Lachnospiraceae bacterium]|nr:PfkB family carbohydrate kinase [Lachnospiraceae bacterium]MDD3795506.1 PfkB family carbohydrate kinase [Lachnospiraceae bacterium]
MKQVLVIGSAVVDVIINLDQLPGRSQDVHVLSQTMSLGGCAYNTSDIIRHFKVPYIPFFPVGRGAYGDFVRTHLAARSIVSPLPTPDQENGCCYCFVEADGERTFVSYHGAEYRFKPDWFDLLDSSSIDMVYICGLEIEESTGEYIIQYLEAHPEFTVFFAPGPRINIITEERLKRLFALSPILHLNEEEAIGYSGKENLKESAEFLYHLTHNTVIITLGKEGSYYYDGTESSIVAGVPATQIDTIGAGDSHIGAIIACLAKGYSMPQALSIANRISAAVVETNGALLSDEAFEALKLPVEVL